MYTLDTAARALGVCKDTVRRWIRLDNLPVATIVTDKKRVYLAHRDLLALAHKHQPLNIKPDPHQRYPDLSGLYPIKDVIRVFGVTDSTINKWIRDLGIEKQFIITDRRRAYLSYSHLVTLAHQYNRTIPHGPSVQTKLYTVAETALFLGVSEMTVKRWLLLHHIEKKTVETNPGDIYITYSDAMLLATAHNCASQYPLTLITDIRAMRYRLEKIEASIINLERTLKERDYETIVRHPRQHRTHP